MNDVIFVVVILGNDVEEDLKFVCTGGDDQHVISTSLGLRYWNCQCESPVWMHFEGSLGENSSSHQD